MTIPSNMTRDFDEAYGAVQGLSIPLISNAFPFLFDPLQHLRLDYHQANSARL